MKRTAVICMLIGFLWGCENNGNITGFYKVLEKSSEPGDYNKNPHYYRINGDTLVLITIKDLSVDSTRFVWDGDWYQNFDDKFLGNDKITYDKTNYLDIQTVKFGNTKYKVLSKDKLTFQYDTIKNPEIGGMKDVIFGLLFQNKDTLQKVDKRYITTALKKDMTKDSLLYFNPYVTVETAKSEIIPFLMQNYNDSFQKINFKSLETYRLADNKFRINFEVKRPYGTIGDYKLEIIFNKESYKIQMK